MLCSLKFLSIIVLVFVNKSVECFDKYHEILQTEIKSPGRSMAVGRATKDRVTPIKEMDSNYWLEQAQINLQKRLQRNVIRNKKAKNIIFFLGDGMSIATITAARILKGQRKGLTGEESILTMEEEFPYTGFSKTYCTNGQTADSACSATAYLTGVKTNLRMVGVNANVSYLNCTAGSDPANHVESIASWAQKAGKSTGIVTTTTVTHASPSGSYAHVASRNWESDNDILKNNILNTEDCADIAKQLIENEPGKNFDVIMGGGLTKFLPNTMNDAFGSVGERRDGLDLIEKWKSQNLKGAFVTSLNDLNRLDYNEVDKIVGLFHSAHLEYNVKPKLLNPSQPRLKDMTASAIQLLEKNPEGYFVFIEGGRIDHGHHQTRAGYALDETLEFDEAIKTAVDMTNEEETLIVVTADHSHAMTIAGYPGRGNPILGMNQYEVDADGIPFSILNYAVGRKQYLENFEKSWRRKDLTMEHDDFMIKPSYIRGTFGHHDGEDVAIFARGPQSHLFSGTMEQNVIPHLMAYAACIGNGAKFCDEQNNLIKNRETIAKY